MMEQDEYDIELINLFLKKKKKHSPLFEGPHICQLLNEDFFPRQGTMIFFSCEHIPHQ
jgi:hypothetical protein